MAIRDQWVTNSCHLLDGRVGLIDGTPSAVEIAADVLIAAMDAEETDVDRESIGEADRLLAVYFRDSVDRLVYLAKRGNGRHS